MSGATSPSSSATESDDGGWDWPLLDSTTSESTAPNILAPTAMGLLAAYQQTGDPSLLAALREAGNYLLLKHPEAITPEDGYLAVALDEVFDGNEVPDVNVYTEFVKANFYDPLASGTYDYLGNRGYSLTDIVDTEHYILRIRETRARQGLPNLAAVDLGLGLYAAHLMGADTSAWIAGVKAEINELSSTTVYDVMGLAASVLGLASVGEDFDPMYGDFAGAGSLADLAAMLAGYQLATGGFTWNGYMMDEGVGNEEAQETAFAILALSEFDREAYANVIANAATYLKSVQLATGGWENAVGYGEYNEVTGEVLWALASTIPLPETQDSVPEEVQGK